MSVCEGSLAEGEAGQAPDQEREGAAKRGVAEMRLLRSLCPLCKYSVPVFFSPFLPPASQPQTTLLIKGFCKKDVKENRTFQEGCQKKWLNEAEGQLESGVKEGDKGAI